MEEILMMPLLHPEVYDDISSRTRQSQGGTRPRAVIFEGPPGCGKTSSARYASQLCCGNIAKLWIQAVVSIAPCDSANEWCTSFRHSYMLKHDTLCLPGSFLTFQSVSFHSERQFASNATYHFHSCHQSKLFGCADYRVQHLIMTCSNWGNSTGWYKLCVYMLHPTDIRKADQIRCCRVLATQAAATLVYIPVEKLFSKWYVSISFIFLFHLLQCLWGNLLKMYESTPVNSIWHRPT